MARFVNSAVRSSSPEMGLENLIFVGNGLNRQECVRCPAHGDLYAADWRRGRCTHLPNGEQRLDCGRAPDARELRPNGISLQVDGVDLPPCNFVVTDHAGRTWITVSTRKIPRANADRRSVSDGFIVMVDEKGARIVADNLADANEAAIDPSECWLYVNQTFGRCLSRFLLKANGDLGSREVFTEFGAATFPDGLAFDVGGGAWVTSIISNQVVRVLPDGRQQLFLEDSNIEHVAWVERAFQDDDVGRSPLDAVKSRCLRNISSLAFGEPDRRTACLGCLLGESIGCLALPFSGHPLPHWNYH